jgi:RES domain-containing protein
MNREDFPSGYVVVEAHIPVEFSVSWTDVEHEFQRRGDQLYGDTQNWGDIWLEQQVSAMLEVPSMVVLGESNFLLNPRHSDFAKIVVEPPTPFEFDPRLFRR